MILLSDAKMQTVIDQWFNKAQPEAYPPYNPGLHKAIAKAQAKEDFGWLAGFPWRNNKDSTISIRIPNSELLAALDEVKHDTTE